MLGYRLKELRKENGLEAQFIAKQLNIAKSTYSGYENNKSVPNYELLDKLANLFNVSTDYLLGRTDIRNVSIVEGKEIPKELRDIGIEYLEINKELKKKGFTPEKIRSLIKSIEELKLNE